MTGLREDAGRVLWQAMDTIDANPDRHLQTVWRRPYECGSAFCLFGWIVELDPRADWLRADAGYSEMVYLDAEYQRELRLSQQVVEITTFVERRLGLNRYQAYSLYEPNATRDQLRQRITYLVGPKGDHSVRPA